MLILEIFQLPIAAFKFTERKTDDCSFCSTNCQVQFLRSKNLFSSEDTSKNVNIFEDLSRPRVNFIEVNEETRGSAMFGRGKVLFN